MSMRTVFLEHFARYPLMEPQDSVKLAYQSALGAGHLLRDPSAAKARLSEELSSCPTSPGQPLMEDIGEEYQRLYLSSIECKGIHLDSLFFLFSKGAGIGREKSSLLPQALKELQTLAAQGRAPFTIGALEIFLRKYLEAGCSSVHHSEKYRGAYSPAYRVMERRLLRFLPLFQAIDGLLAEGRPIRVAIDGMAAAGKSTLGRLLAERYDCTLLHMDDFFLPPELRNPERLATPGGNVHYERFRTQVLEPLAAGKSFSFPVFDCRAMAYGEDILVKPTSLTVVEGAYALHPALRDFYDFKVFYSVRPEEQLTRIRLRNGETCVPRFRDKWIPLENRYIEACGIRAHCDFIL